MKNEMASKILFGLSVLTVVLAGVVSVFSMSLWLAGTQWMLVGIVLGIWALLTKE